MLCKPEQLIGSKSVSYHIENIEIVYLIRSYKILCSLNYISVFISGKKLGAYGSIKYITQNCRKKYVN